MLNRVEFNSQPQKNSLSFGISKQHLENIIKTRQLKIVSVINDTPQGDMHYGFLIKTEKTFTDFTRMLAVLKDNVVKQIVGSGKSHKEMMENMAQSIPGNALIVKPRRHLGEFIAKT